jgi:putative transposase
MRYDPEQHHRRSIRRKGYDYTQAGAYFITLVTQDRVCLFGEVIDEEMQLNRFGEIVWECWQAIPEHFPHASLDAFVVMPNHVHGIIILNETKVGAQPITPQQSTQHITPQPQLHAIPRTATEPYANHPPTETRLEQFGKPVAGSIPTIVRSFKAAVTKRINEYRGTPGAIIWQRNYYEHIIRNEDDLEAIREYIVMNPLRWHLDRENVHAIGTDPSV